MTTTSAPGSTLRLVARKSNPRYDTPKQSAEIVRSTDASPYGGSQGFLLSAVAESEKSTVFMQDTAGIFADVDGTLTTIAYSGAPTPVGAVAAFRTAGTCAANGATSVPFRAIGTCPGRRSARRTEQTRWPSPCSTCPCRLEVARCAKPMPPPHAAVPPVFPTVPSSRQPSSRRR